LREIFQQEEEIDPVEKTRQLYKKIVDLGLQPYEAPEPFPPIEEEEIKLVCWMAVAPEDRLATVDSAHGE
jgi:hypothetical protein